MKRFFASAWTSKIKQSEKYQQYITSLSQYFNSIFWITDRHETWKNPTEYDTLALDLASDWRFAHSSDIRLAGILCPWMIPSWYKADSSSFTANELRAYLQDYIKFLLSYNFYSYDFLLEKVGYDGNPANDYLMQKLGANHIEDLLEYASNIKGSSKLVLSDFGYKLTEKWEGNIRLLKQFQNKKLIDGVAIQLQINIVPGIQIQTIDTLIKRIQDLGYEVELPECTVWENVYTPPHLFGMQERIYNQIFDLVLANGIKTFGFFSPFDEVPWNFRDCNCRPGFLDKTYKPKFWTKNFLERVQKWLDS